MQIYSYSQLLTHLCKYECIRFVIDVGRHQQSLNWKCILRFQTSYKCDKHRDIMNAYPWGMSRFHRCQVLSRFIFKLLMINTICVIYSCSTDQLVNLVQSQREMASFMRNEQASVQESVYGTSDSQNLARI